jgi:branched-chain amino acid transport system permease protein
MAILVVRFDVPLFMGAGGGIAAAVPFIVGIPSLRLRADYLAIATVAASEVVRCLAMNLPDLTGGPVGSIGMLGLGQFAMYNGERHSFINHITPAGLPRDATVAALVWALAVLTIAGLGDLERSPWGRAMRSICEDEAAATASGENVFAFKMQALVLGAVLGAISDQPTLTFYAYLILILGGSNRIWAIPLGAVLFSLLWRMLDQVESARVVYAAIPNDHILKGFRRNAGQFAPATACAAGARIPRV